MPARRPHRRLAQRLRLLEARLRTGAGAHLLGGALDLAAALLAYARARRRARAGAHGRDQRH